MRNEVEKFNHSVSVLVTAFFNDTLMHGNCYACAVGNMVANGLGCRVVKRPDSFKNLVWDNNQPYPGSSWNDSIQNGWGALFTTDRHDDKRKTQKIDKRFLGDRNVMRQIASTGYTWQELARIEFAFESVDKRRKDKMFNGLMAVVDVLAEIHNIDLSTKENAKSLFVKV